MLRSSVRCRGMFNPMNNVALVLFMFDFNHLIMQERIIKKLKNKIYINQVITYSFCLVAVDVVNDAFIFN